MKGSFYVLESAIAAIMMITVVSLILRSPTEVVDMSKANYKLKVFEALKIADDVGDLRKNAIEDDAQAIEEGLNPYIPPFINYEVTVYNKTSNTTVIPIIDSKDVITVSYYLTGQAGIYSPREVRVFVWGVD